MPTEELYQALYEQLFGGEWAHVYAVLDGASVPRLPQTLARLEPEHVCLYRGDLAPDIAEVAPYLVQLEPETDFTELVLAEGWSHHWGIFAASDDNLRRMRQHFRQFLTVHDEQGTPFLFRYYDPRVLRMYLPTCNEEELKTIFGRVACYMLEGGEATTLFRFRQDSGTLHTERHALVRQAQTMKL